MYFRNGEVLGSVLHSAVPDAEAPIVEVSPKRKSLRKEPEPELVAPAPESVPTLDEFLPKAEKPSG